MTNKRYTYIPKRMKSVNKEDPYVTGAEDIDAGNGKSQQVKNTEVDETLTQLSNEIDAVNKQDVIPVDTLPAVATADPKKIYRVVGEDSYTDYMVNATHDGWKELATYSFPGIDDEPTAGSENPVRSGGVQNELALGAVYDVSAKNPTAGPNNDGKWESLSALLLDSNLNTLIPTAVRKGGMSIKFVRTSDNKYVQFRYMGTDVTTAATFTNTANWQGVDSEITLGSRNLAESGSVVNWVSKRLNIKSPTVPYQSMTKTSQDTAIFTNKFDNIVKAYGVEIYAPNGTVEVYKVNTVKNVSTFITSFTVEQYLVAQTFMFDSPIDLDSNEYIGLKGILKYTNTAVEYINGSGVYSDYTFLPNFQIAYSVLTNSADNDSRINAIFTETAKINSNLLNTPSPIPANSATDANHIYGNKYGMLSKVYGITLIGNGTIEIYKLDFNTREYELIDTHTMSSNLAKDYHFFSEPIVLGETEIIATKGVVLYSNTATPHTYPLIPCGIETVEASLPNMQLAVELLTTLRDTLEIIANKCSQIKDIPGIEIDVTNVSKLIFDYSVDAVSDVICIGDSMTEGVIVDYDNIHVAAAAYLTYSYPTVLSHLTGWTIENAGYGGIDALNWWEHEFNKYDYSSYKLALIELGQNHGLTDTLIEDTTISEGQTYLDYASTNTGSYCKIIEGIQNANSRILIVIVISPRLNPTTRSVIFQIIEKYNLPYIDLKDHTMINLEDDKYHGKSYQGTIDYIHYTRSGYIAKAIMIKNYLFPIIDNYTNIMNFYPDEPSHNPQDWQY